MQNAESVGLKKDHIGISKFSDREDWDFGIVASHLAGMAEDALPEVTGRWDRYERHEGILYLSDSRLRLT